MSWCVGVSASFKPPESLFSFFTGNNRLHLTNYIALDYEKKKVHLCSEVTLTIWPFPRETFNSVSKHVFVFFHPLQEWFIPSFLKTGVLLFLPFHVHFSNYDWILLQSVIRPKKYNHVWNDSEIKAHWGRWIFSEQALWSWWNHEMCWNCYAINK